MAAECARSTLEAGVRNNKDDLGSEAILHVP